MSRPPKETRKIVRIRTLRPTAYSANTTIPLHDGERVELREEKHGVLVIGERITILVPWPSIVEVQYDY